MFTLKESSNPGFFLSEKTYLTSYVLSMFWVTILYKYHESYHVWDVGNILRSSTRINQTFSSRLKLCNEKGGLPTVKIGNFSIILFNSRVWVLSSLDHLCLSSFFLSLILNKLRSWKKPSTQNIKNKLKQDDKFNLLNFYLLKQL